MNNIYSTTSLLATSPSLLADLLDHLPHGVIAYEAIRDADDLIIDYRTLFYNPQVLKITGYTAEEINGQLLFQRAPHVRNQTEALRRVVDEHIAFDVQELLPTNNRWFAFENRPLTNGFFTVIRDISDLKVAEQQLELKNAPLRQNAEQAVRQQMLLRSVLNASPGSLTVERAIRNEYGEIIDFQAILINQAALTLGGHSEEAVLNRRISELNPQFKPSGLHNAYVAVVETGEPFNVEFFFAPKDKYIQLTATRMDEEHIIVLFNDVTQARLDAQALEQKNSLLDGILRTSASAIIVYESVHSEHHEVVDFRIVLANKAAGQTFGLAPEDTVGQQLTSLYPNTKQTGLWHQYIEVCRTGQTYQGRYFDLDVQKWFDVTINKLGQGIVATFNDVTTAQHATQQVEEQARMFDSVLSNITNGLAVFEVVRDETGDLTDLRYLRVSQTVLGNTGLNEHELVGNTLLTLFPGVKTTGYWAAIEELLRTGEPQHFETHYNVEGFDNYTDNWVTRIDDNRILIIYLIINDRKRIEMQAQEQAATLKSVLDSCQMPIVLFEAIRDDQQRIIDFRYLIQNEANARTVGHPVSQTTQKTMLEVLPGLKASGIFDRYVSVVETGASQRFEQFIQDGPVNGWFELSIVKEGDGIVVAANDQTLLRQTLQRAEQLVVDLQRSNASLEQFAYVASHDLQEPLRKIQSFGDVLINQYSMSLPTDARDMLRRMQSAASRMSILIRDLLTYSRLSTHQDPFQPVNLRTVLTDILIDFELTINEKKAHIGLSDDSTIPLPTIIGNPAQLRQLFQNLIGNALKFSKPDVQPQISIAVRAVVVNELPNSLQSAKPGNWTAITVSDNGIGFDEHYQERIFQLFERLHGRSEYAGTGIGLAICRKVAENHGGTIIARSQPGQGATFTVYLPLGS